MQRYSSKLMSKTYLSYLKKVYKVLQKFYVNEYVYKNEFLNQWLIKELGSEKSIIYNELRLGNAVADLVMFNGCSRVFEIKTLLDKESRLTSQLEAYKKVFNEIYLIVPNSKMDTYRSYEESIGLITYDQENRNFLLIREAEKNNIIDVDSIMEVLHTKEYRKIVNEYFGSEKENASEKQADQDTINEIEPGNLSPSGPTPNLHPTHITMTEASQKQLKKDYLKKKQTL